MRLRSLAPKTRVPPQGTPVRRCANYAVAY